MKAPYRRKAARRIVEVLEQRRLLTLVNFDYTATDAATGSGTISGMVDTSSIGGPGVLEFVGDIPLHTINQKDTTELPVPQTAVGFTNRGGTPLNGNPNGFHLGWTGTVTMFSQPDSMFAIDVPLDAALKQGNIFVYDVTYTDDNSGAGGSQNILDGVAWMSGWIGEDGAGHRHSGQQIAYTADLDTIFYSVTTDMDTFVEGDDVGIGIAQRNNLNGATSFVEEVRFQVELNAEDSSLRAVVPGAPEVINLASDTLVYHPGQDPQIVDQASPVVVTDDNSASYDGGRLVVSLEAGGDLDNDVLSISADGDADLVVSGIPGTVSYQGTEIGTIAGGAGAPLEVTFNAESTVESVQAVMRSVAFSNIDAARPEIGQRTVLFQLTDDTQNSRSATTVVRVNPFPGTILGTGTGSLLGNDLTDPDEDGVLDVVQSIASRDGTNATDNNTGPNNKVCCENDGPSFFGWEFESPFQLTHFTIAAANDSVEGGAVTRNPDLWSLEASDDGMIWDEVFRWDLPDQNIFGQNQQVLLFKSPAADDALPGDVFHFPEQTTAHTHYRFVFQQTAAPVGQNLQFSELEIFGETNNGIEVVSVDINSRMVDPEDLDGQAQATSWVQQRSDIRTVDVHFDATIDATTLDGIELINHGVDASLGQQTMVDLSDDQIVTITTEGERLSLDFAPYALEDGAYELRIPGTLGSDTGATLGEQFVYRADPTNRFYHLSADWNGDGGVSIFDFPTLAYWFGESVPRAPEYGDCNQDGGVTIFDINCMASNFGSFIVFPPVAREAAELPEFDSFQSDSHVVERVRGEKRIAEQLAVATRMVDREERGPGRNLRAQQVDVALWELIARDEI